VSRDAWFYAKILAPHVRGDSFDRTFGLTGEWLGAQFSQIKFTIRKKLPATADLDTDVLAQVTKTGGGIQFDPLDDASGFVSIAASVTNLWEPGVYFWELQGTVAGSPQKVYTLESGKLNVVSDLTRIP
jgi:hypothetical protein